MKNKQPKGIGGDLLQGKLEKYQEIKQKQKKERYITDSENIIENISLFYSGYY